VRARDCAVVEPRAHDIRLDLVGGGRNLYELRGIGGVLPAMSEQTSQPATGDLAERVRASVVHPTSEALSRLLPPEVVAGALGRQVRTGRPTTPITLMPQPHSDTIRPGSGGTVGAWRRRRLVAAGFAPRLAAELAAEPGLDLHELLLLLDQGCPPTFAARILAPLDAAELRC
jgi:hypothetical protein